MSVNPRTYKKMTNDRLSAGQRIEMWKYYFPEDHVDALLDQLSILYSNELNNPYLRKNPIFPTILDYLYPRNPELAELFIHCFYPKEVYEQFMLHQQS
ncbi:hypothetical protein [Bacillus sp. 1P06AnD]|uniref:hypothetical protein n=1 Tax=Bacillus sp. 1P06AnD TaxID=3132208 RepID=UPI0039A326C6